MTNTQSPARWRVVAGNVNPGGESTFTVETDLGFRIQARYDIDLGWDFRDDSDDTPSIYERHDALTAIACFLLPATVLQTELPERDAR